MTFFDLLPCAAGYGGTSHRTGLDTPPAPVDADARCAEPGTSGIDVRGSAHAPSGGGVPQAANPGLASLLGVAP
ncbi:MAG TPA: hypothetical protein VFQ44_11025 [Streptosporangiaceae bacterium]|nr:hypothetical protein [Streptosporangiaceae bacterium]